MNKYGSKAGLIDCILFVVGIAILVGLAILLNYG